MIQEENFWWPQKTPRQKVTKELVPSLVSGDCDLVGDEAGRD